MAHKGDSDTQAPNTLRKLRREKRLTLKAVSAQIGVSEPTIWRWENEVPGRVPNVTQASALADIYGVTVEQIAAMFSNAPDASAS